jgi:hypothetical protein
MGLSRRCPLVERGNSPLNVVRGRTLFLPNLRARHYHIWLRMILDFAAPGVSPGGSNATRDRSRTKSCSVLTETRSSHFFAAERTMERWASIAEWGQLIFFRPR